MADKLVLEMAVRSAQDVQLVQPIPDSLLFVIDDTLPTPNLSIRRYGLDKIPKALNLSLGPEGVVGGTGVATQVAFWSSTNVISGSANFTLIGSNNVLNLTGAGSAYQIIATIGDANPAVQISVGQMALGPGGATALDTFLVRDAPNVYAMKNGTNAQEFRVYQSTSVLSYGSLSFIGGTFRVDAFGASAAVLTIGTNASSVTIGSGTFAHGVTLSTGATPLASTDLVGMAASETIASGAGAVWSGIHVYASTATLTGSTSITTAAGFNLVVFEIPTISAASALTVTTAATVTIMGAPGGAGAGPATITNKLAFWVQAGASRYDSLIHLGAAPSSITAVIPVLGEVDVSGWKIGLNGSAYGIGVASSTTVFMSGTWVSTFTSSTLPANNGSATVPDTSATFSAGPNGVVLPLVLAAASPNVGQLWNDSVQQTYTTFLGNSTANGVKIFLGGSFFVTTATTTISASGDTTMVGTGIGTKTLPANFMVIGKTVIIEVFGTVVTGATPGTATISLKLGGVTIAVSGAVNVPASLTAGSSFHARFIITARTVPGATATVFGQGYFYMISSVATAVLSPFPIVNNANTVATNATALVDCSINFSNANNTLTVTNVLFYEAM